MYAQFRAYDVAALVIVTPLVVLLSVSVPDDVANHQGRTLRGTATVIRVEPLRGGDVATFEVASASGEVVGTADDVYGLDGDVVGASFPVNYLPQGSRSASVAAYALGEDPLAVNLTLLLVTGSAWLLAGAFVARRLGRLLPQRASRRYRSTGSYEARAR